MRKLGKNNDEILETIEAFGCSHIRTCDCGDGDRKTYLSINDNEYWREFWD